MNTRFPILFNNPTRTFRFFSGSIGLLIILSCSMKGQQSTSPHEIVYEIFVQSFCDSNGDGIGDIQGLISKLDYIQSLGVTAIWIMPIHPSPSYHKYDVTDFYGIHPDYGNWDDMRELIREVHRRDMKLILDLVINHTSYEHPWFQAAASSPDDPKRQYYVWRNFEEVKDEIEKKSTTFDSDNVTQWHEISGSPERYYGFFWKGMPDLNFDFPPLRDEIYNIGAFWVAAGIDGFRLDAAKHIYPDDRLDDTRKFWIEFRQKMQQLKPELMIIGEVWSDSATLATLFEGLPSLFNFELAKLIEESIQTQNPAKLSAGYQGIQKAYDASGQPYDDAILLSNHDMNRIRSVLEDNIEKSKLAAAILLSLPGTPYIYYGEEIGMLGVKPDPNLREPFIWNENTTAENHWTEIMFNKEPLVQSLEKQKSDPGSMYHHYVQWIHWRNENSALHAGTIEFLHHGFPGILAFIRKSDDQRLMVLHNLTGEEKEIRIGDDFVTPDTTLVIKDEKVIILPAFGSALLELK